MPSVGYSRNLKRSGVTNRLQRKRDQLWRTQPLQQRLPTLWPPCCEEAHSITRKMPWRGEWDALESLSVLPCHLTPAVWKLGLLRGQLLASKTEIVHLITIYTSTWEILREWFGCVHLAYRTMRNNCFEPLYIMSCHTAKYLSILILPLISCVPLCTFFIQMRINHNGTDYRDY